MGQIITGGSVVTGANVTDKSLSVADLTDADVEALEPTSLTQHPYPVGLFGTGTNSVYNLALNVNTTAHVSLVKLDRKITVNKITVNNTLFSVAGTLKIALFSEDGQTRLVSVETASISGAAVVTTSLAQAVVLPAGNYWIAILSVGTADIGVLAYASPASTAGALMNGVSGEPIINGTYTVTASTMPTALTLGDITATDTTGQTPVFRLDN
jgi:hypothetical protein